MLIRDRQKRPKRRVILISAAFALGVAAAVVAFRMRDDPAVMDDIDRHFAGLDRGRYEPTGYPGDPGGNRAQEGEGTLSGGGKRLPAAGGAGRRAGAARKGASREGSTADGAPGGAGDPQEAPIREGVRQVAPLTYEIDGALAAEARKNPRPFVRRARAALEEVDGEPVGFRIRLRGNEALRAIGIEDGDVVTAVNGRPLRSVDEVIVAAAALRFSDRFRLDVLRGDQKLSFYYRVGQGAP